MSISKLKHRQLIYVVVRSDGCIMDSFFSFEAADDQATTYTQKFVELNAPISFDVKTSYYYDC